MTVKEFLGQAYLLDQRIRSYSLECAELREMAKSISSPAFEEHYNASRNTDAPYIHTLEKLWEMEERALCAQAILVKLKEQIEQVVSRVEKPELQAVLRYRYIHNYTWSKVADIMKVDESTVRRWNNRAVAAVALPIDAVDLTSEKN